MEKLRTIYKKVCDWLKVLKDKIIAGFKMLADKAIAAYVQYKVNKRIKDKNK